MALGTKLNKEKANKKKIDKALKKAQGTKKKKKKASGTAKVTAAQTRKRKKAAPKKKKIVKKGTSFSHGFN